MASFVVSRKNVIGTSLKTNWCRKVLQKVPMPIYLLHDLELTTSESRLSVSSDFFSFGLLTSRFSLSKICNFFVWKRMRPTALAPRYSHLSWSDFFLWEFVTDRVVLQLYWWTKELNKRIWEAVSPISYSTLKKNTFKKTISTLPYMKKGVIVWIFKQKNNRLKYPKWVYLC